MKNKILSTQSLHADLGKLLLRLIFGGLFIYIGYGKIEHYDQYLPMFKDYIGLGVKTSYNLVIFAEFFCGILVTIGLFTRLAVIPILIAMIVVYFIALKGQGFNDKQLALLFLILSLVIFILGSGKYSVDALLFRKKNRIA
ncbi:MAG TPA: DoxX family protein [Chitinophagaceae bacterium]|nr:DoxX family protein [Chitinophagaceae bacterium]